MHLRASVRAVLLSLVRRGRRGPALAAIAAALVGLGAGCGGDHETDVARGKRLFTGEGRCGGCHVLARAGTRGTVGPNLDDALVQARRDGLGQSTLEDVSPESADADLYATGDYTIA